MSLPSLDRFATVALMQALVVSDDVHLVDSLGVALREANYDVVTSESGAEAIDLVVRYAPSALLLERDLPDIDGFEVCRRIRRLPDGASILMFSYAAQSVAERVSGLDVGADAYMAKPLVISETVARVRALTRRRHAPDRRGPLASCQQLSEDPIPLTWCGLKLDPTLYAVATDAAFRPLTPTEYRLLELFMCNPERVLSHADIERQVWGFESPGSAKVRVYIGYLRHKMAECGAGQLIHTVPREGYFLR